MDKLRLASGSTRAVPTTLSLPKANGATTAELTVATGWNVTTDVDFVMYRRQLNTTTGSYEKVDGTQTEWVASLTGTTLSAMDLRAGVEPTNGYPADGNTVVYAGPTSAWGDDLVNAMLGVMNQDGTLKTAAVQAALGISADPAGGWDLLNAGIAPNTVTALGNHSYQVVYNGVDLTGVVSNGMRIKAQRSVAAPTRSTSLNGTNQYYTKSAPAGMTATDDITGSAWIKLTNYPTTASYIQGRYDGTNGWLMEVGTDGKVAMIGINNTGANQSSVRSYQSLPINKWVHVAAQLDMSSFTATTTTSYIMIDGMDVPASVQRQGTNPTAFALGTGAYQVGAANSGGFFPGKIAQVAIYSAKVTQANILARMNQTLTGTETSLVSAYSFNSSTSDLNTTNANNLTASGSAVATNADSPFAQGATAGLLEYGIVMASAFSTNTTFTIQTPEGSTLPTTGGIANISYSSQDVPFGFPKQSEKWRLESSLRTSVVVSGPSIGTWYRGSNTNSWKLSPPTGAWKLGYRADIYGERNPAGQNQLAATLSQSISAEDDRRFTRIVRNHDTFIVTGHVFSEQPVSLSAPTTYNMLFQSATSGLITLDFTGSLSEAVIYADNAYL